MNVSFYVSLKNFASQQATVCNLSLEHRVGASSLKTAFLQKDNAVIGFDCADFMH